ncbi:hypothetical protein HY772_03815 [Candidatus Woesearchaeota archaeon]|nr:hypothetical protein [Candidatus Woesearchaeota archaeon]
MTKADPLQVIGIILLLLGVVVILSAVPLVEQSVFPGIDTVAEKVPPVSATRIIVGLTISILGLIVGFRKKGLEWLRG